MNIKCYSWTTSEFYISSDLLARYINDHILCDIANPFVIHTLTQSVNQCIVQNYTLKKLEQLCEATI